jgi:predicted TPR repeat methyltransferase
MPLTTFHSSSNLIADRRFAYGQDLARENDHQAASELYEQTLELVPDYAPAWFELGKAYIALNNPEAKAAFTRCLALEPDDRLGAGLYLTHTMSTTYVSSLFDSYAHKFDTHLTNSLNYRGPKMLRLALEGFFTQQSRACKFSTIIDLGCGTGLSGAEFAHMTSHMIGCDLSAGMIEQARRKNIYTYLLVEDAISCLNKYTADLVLAVDVLVYMGDLQPLFESLKQRLTPNGIFAFSAQHHDGSGYVLGSDMRYAHSVSYIEQLAQVNDLKVELIQQVSMRQDRGVDVAGLIVIISTNKNLQTAYHPKNALIAQ